MTPTSSQRPRDLPMLEVVHLQQEACERAGSQLYARVLDAMADDVAADGPIAGILEPWSENALADAIPLRFLAAVHRIVLSGRAPALARFYPSAGGDDPGDPVPAFISAVAEHAAEIEASMHLGVQTNEVGRAASLVGGFHHVAIETGLPLRTLEVGASAGLLMRWDHYRYDVGEIGWGVDEGVRFRDPWVHDTPRLSVAVRVGERHGCDINPIDPASPEGVIALRGFLWPDQIERRRRLDAAIEVARRHPAVVEHGDAGEWIERQLSEPVPGLATVVYHSIVLQYLPRPSFQRMRSAIEQAGERSTADAPLAWLRMEPAGDVADVRVRMWPGGDDVLLATTGYHGPPVEWLAG